MSKTDFPSETLQAATFEISEAAARFEAGDERRPVNGHCIGMGVKAHGRSMLIIDMDTMSDEMATLIAPANDETRFDGIRVIDPERNIDFILNGLEVMAVLGAIVSSVELGGERFEEVAALVSAHETILNSVPVHNAATAEDIKAAMATPPPQ